MNTLIKIHFEEKGGSHEDIMVSVPRNGFQGLFDSYYLGLDDKIKTDLKGIEKIKLVLKSLIRYWIKNIIEAKDGQIIYLPIDFSDQYTGCFCIEKRGDDLFVSYGYSLVEGWSISPSDPEGFSVTINDFKKDPNFSSFLVSQDEFVSSLNKNIESFNL